MLEISVFLCGAVVMVIELTGSRVLAPYLGTSLVVWTSLIGIILASLSLGYWWGGRVADRRPEARLLGQIILLAAFSTAAIALTKSLVLGFFQAQGFVDRDTPYNRVIVFKGADNDTGRLMRVMVTGPHARQSAMYLDDPSALALPYTRYFRLAEHFVPQMKRMLVLGGGGFSFPKYALAHYPDVRVDVVELDPGVTTLARDYFELKDHPRQRIIAEDARTFLNRNGEAYDAILCDTFNSHYAIPFHLTTLEAAQRMHAALASNGVALVNLLSALSGERSHLFHAVFATYKRVFPRVLAFAVRNTQDGSSWQNIILAAFASPDEPLLADPDPDMAAMLARRLDIPAAAEVAPLTDDYAPVDRYIMSAW